MCLKMTLFCNMCWIFTREKRFLWRFSCLSAPQKITLFLWFFLKSEIYSFTLIIPFLFKNTKQQNKRKKKICLRKKRRKITIKYSLVKKKLLVFSLFFWLQNKILQIYSTILFQLIFSKVSLNLNNFICWFRFFLLLYDEEFYKSRWFLPKKFTTSFIAFNEIVLKGAKKILN